MEIRCEGRGEAKEHGDGEDEKGEGGGAVGSGKKRGMEDQGKWIEGRDGRDGEGEGGERSSQKESSFVSFHCTNCAKLKGIAED